MSVLLNSIYMYLQMQSKVWRSNVYIGSIQCLYFLFHWQYNNYWLKCVK